MSDSIFFGLSSYDQHMTDEGWQFQEGMRQAGWHLVGHGFDDPRRDVAAVLEAERPERVIIQDHREWHRGYPGAFDKAAHFENFDVLADYDGLVCTILKDAHQKVQYQWFHDAIGLDIALHYYHQRSILPHCPWLGGGSGQHPDTLRTYHTVDADAVPRNWPKKRQDWLVSGAMIKRVYPMRRTAKALVGPFGGSLLPHPGYGLKGWRTPGFLQELAKYKVHVCTASVYGYLLRKIIESTACGCVVVTNLPEWDRVPGIDENLVRVEDESPAGLKKAITKALDIWSEPRQRRLADEAMRRFDYRAECERINRLL